MSPLKKGVLANPPRAPKVKSLADIYAAEDARKAASNLPSEFASESSSTKENMESEPLDFAVISSSFASEENDLNAGGWGACKISLKDLRARCKATKKRKADAEPKEADDLDEPLIILKTKISKSSCAVRSKSIVTNAISESSILQGSKGLAEEDPQGFQEILSVQTDCNTTSSSKDVTNPGAGALGLIYHVKSEPRDEIDMTNYSLYSDNESVLEVEPINSAPWKVNFVAKLDSSCDPSSSVIWLTNENTSRKKVVCFLNKACADIVESEENFYIPENHQDNLPQSEIMDAEIGESAVDLTGNDLDANSLICSFNGAGIDGQSEKNLYPPGNSQGSSYEARITEVGSDANPATVTVKLPTGQNHIFLLKEKCMDNVESLENLYSSERTEKKFPQSEIVKVQDGASAVPITENMPGGKDLIFPCMVSGGDLYSPEGRQDNLHKSEVTEVGSDASPVKLISPDRKHPFSSNEACNINEEHEENIYSLASSRNNSEKSENALVEGIKSQVMVTDGATVDALVNIHTESANNDNYGFLCEEAPDFLDTTNLRSSEGQLESIVYSAIASSKCFYKKEDDASTSVHSVLGSPTENSETGSNYGNGVVTKFGEVFEGSNQVQCTDIFERETSGVLQLCNNLEKEQSSVTNNEALKLEKEVKGDPGTTTERAPIKLLSNRTIISPTSQEKLCQALTDIDLREGAQSSKSKKKILFENCTGMKKCAITTQTTENVFQKSTGVIKKGNPKSTGAACTRDSSVKMDTEKAIEFSRRQMHDFENVTTKLLKNMRFMKSVLDESLAVQSPWVSKFSADEIKAASENASELERTTKRWLALMSKDCNRFCKILKSAGNNASSPPTCKNGDQNRRRIVFADEAGGVLCHIRVFTEASSPLATAETEKSDQQI